MERILMLLLVSAITVYCKPVETQEDDQKFQKYSDEIAALTKRVESIRHELKEEDTKAPNSLEDSLEAAAAEDSKNKVAENDAHDNVKNPKDVPAESDEDFYGDEEYFKDDLDFLNGEYDDDFDNDALATDDVSNTIQEDVVEVMEDPAAKKAAAKKAAAKKAAAKKAPAKKAPAKKAPAKKAPAKKAPAKKAPAKKAPAKKPAAKKAKKPKKGTEHKNDSTSENAQVPFLDQDMQDIVQDEEVKQELQNVKREEMTYLKSAVNNIKDSVHKIKEDFTDVKSLYLAIVKDQPLEEKTKEQFETVKRDIVGVNNGIHDLFTQFSEKDDEAQDESLSEVPNDDTYAMISVMQDQLQGASDAIQVLKDLALTENRKQKMVTVVTGVGTPPDYVDYVEDPMIAKDAGIEGVKGVGEALHEEADGKMDVREIVNDMERHGETGVGKPLDYELDIETSKDSETAEDIEFVKGVGEALEVEETKGVKEEEVEDYDGEMEKLISMRDEVREVIHKMKDIKASIDQD